MIVEKCNSVYLIIISSGLVANQSKSNIYFGGVHEHVQQQTLQLIGFKKGSLSFKYLGVPLSSKRLTVHQCSPMLYKMVDRIKI